MEKHTVAKILTYAGAFPFAGCAILGWTDAFVLYGAIIISFIAGIHWGGYLFKDAPINLFITSNVAALLAWVSAAVMSVTMAQIAFIVCFIGLMAIDYRLHYGKILPRWFYVLRLRISAIVVSILVLNVVFL